ncbi:Mariner Mos1 transposase [Eumeta japonica]|uniref:Mariner Mos1 transposase n=1 Tax=Eumeta variegata TaxID=151549 RepID=A0A4C1Y8G0_EUMVA|nr:Mariner Mos1 transposase [Eumeta japonica]
MIIQKEENHGTTWPRVNIHRKTKYSERITETLYRTQLMRLSRALKEKRPKYYSRHDKIILLHDNARPHVAVPVKNYLKTLDWEVLPLPAAVTRHCAVRLSSVPVNGTRSVRAAVHII